MEMSFFVLYLKDVGRAEVLRARSINNNEQNQVNIVDGLFCHFLLILFLSHSFQRLSGSAGESYAPS